jgi:hypothetical protein
MSIAAPPAATRVELSPVRLHLMRAGYLFIGVGLALVKWPLLTDAAGLPLYEGVTLCMLVTLSLLALLGVRYPIQMLPVLLFESAWKLLWFALVALPNCLQGDVDAATREVMVTSSLVIVVLAVVPWRYVWRTYRHAPADPWRPTASRLQP